MIKKIAWNTFKQTGNINTMLELIEADKAIKNQDMSTVINEVSQMTTNNVMSENNDSNNKGINDNNFRMD